MSSTHVAAPATYARLPRSRREHPNLSPVILSAVKNDKGGVWCCIWQAMHQPLLDELSKVGAPPTRRYLLVPGNDIMPVWGWVLMPSRCPPGALPHGSIVVVVPVLDLVTCRRGSVQRGVSQ